MDTLNKSSIIDEKVSEPSENEYSGIESEDEEFKLKEEKLKEDDEEIGEEQEEIGEEQEEIDEEQEEIGEEQEESDDEEENSEDEEEDIDQDSKFKKKKNKTNKSKTYKSYNTMYINNNLEEEDSELFLQKFLEKNKSDYIINNHQECLTKNFEEIKKLLVIKKNSDGIIIDELHKTIPILTKYEMTKIIGIRVKQLNSGCKPYITINENIIDNFIIANKELKLKKLPFIIERPMPNNINEYWRLQNLEILQ
jgi:DNA-directed RNA polymerase subunit K/omega